MSNEGDFRVRLLGPFEVSQRSTDGTWTLIEKEAWGKGRYARSALKRLLCAPKRRASRGVLQEDIWPDTEPELADQYVNNAINKIRSVFGKDHVKTYGPIYEIEGQPSIWVDIDGCEALLREAENLGYSSAQALPLLEEALASFERGECLEGEDELWCYATRKRGEDAQRQCRLWLAEAYEAQGKVWQAGEQYRALLQSDLPDEEALCSWIGMLHRHGKAQEALKYYNDTKEHFERQSISLSPTTHQLVARLSAEPGLIEVYLARETPRFRASSQDKQDEITGAFWDETRARTLKAFRKPSSVDEVLITHLEVTTKYNRRRLVLSKNSSQETLLTYQDISNQLYTITRLLEHSLPTSLCSLLLSLAGETMQLLGDIFFNAGDNSAAEKYYKSAMKMALEARNDVLCAVILGRKSFLSTYNNNAVYTLEMLEKAKILLLPSGADIIHAWLWAIEAEGQVSMHQTKACQKALEQSEMFLDRARPGITSYSFDVQTDYLPFNRKRLLGYKGVCNLGLQQPQAAQSSLHEYLSLLSPGSLHKKSITLIDLAKAYALEQEIEEAYVYANQALDLIKQTGSIRVFQRLLGFRQIIGVKKDASYTQQLDEHIADVSYSLNVDATIKI